MCSSKFVFLYIYFSVFLLFVLFVPLESFFLCCRINIYGKRNVLDVKLIIDFGFTFLRDVVCCHTLLKTEYYFVDLPVY